MTFALYPLVGWLADSSVDRALYVLAILCAAFAVATKLGDRHFAIAGETPLPAEESPRARRF